MAEKAQLLYQMPVGGSEENTVKQMKMFNATEGWCKDNGVGYLNLFRNLEDMELDFSTDMQDVSHVNRKRQTMRLG